MIRSPGRVVWVRREAFQALTSTPTYNYHFTAKELGRYLDVPAGTLLGILKPPRRDPSNADWLKKFGILSREHHDTTWHLLGCGNLVSLGPIMYNELLNAVPDPMFW